MLTKVGVHHYVGIKRQLLFVFVFLFYLFIWCMNYRIDLFSLGICLVSILWKHFYLLSESELCALFLQS